jgi:AmiR/NasT family two-component response regulator
MATKDSNLLAEAIEAGASGYILKTVASQQIMHPLDLAQQPHRMDLVSS